jgi:hypothetical protein
MRPDDGRIDHVGRSVWFDKLNQCLNERVEHPDLDPSSKAAENAVPFALLVRQVSPL